MNKALPAALPTVYMLFFCGACLLLFRHDAPHAALEQRPAPPPLPESRHPRWSPHRQAIEDEWPEAEQFLHTYAPHYLDAINSLSLPEESRFRLHFAIVNRYQTLKRLKEHYPELYYVRVEQLKLFDQLFDTHRQYLAASGPQREKLKAQMREQVGALVDNSIKERRTRIVQLQDMLSKLGARIERETTDRNGVVEAHLRRVLEKGVDPSLLDGITPNDEPGEVRHVPVLPGPRAGARPTSEPAGE